jgi:hypothetical protein
LCGGRKATEREAFQAARSAGASSSALASTVSGTATISRPSLFNTWRALITVSPTMRRVPGARLRSMMTR